MKIEIWSDIACPFCYIGKKQLEAALDRYEGINNVSVEWRSFQLDPALKTDTSISLAKSLMEKKGWSEEEAQDAMRHVTDMAKQYNLHYNFEKVVVANTFDAHRLLHLSKREGKQTEVKELLMKAYFTDGRNIAERPTLIDIGKAAGLSEISLEIAIYTDQYKEEVNYDMHRARKLGIKGVPFFVFDERYGVSGAQGSDALLKMMYEIQVMNN